MGVNIGTDVLLLLLFLLLLTVVGTVVDAVAVEVAGG